MWYALDAGAAEKAVAAAVHLHGAACAFGWTCSCGAAWDLPEAFCLAPHLRMQTFHDSDYYWVRSQGGESSGCGRAGARPSQGRRSSPQAGLS